jgi:hypothetical protein
MVNYTQSINHPSRTRVLAEKASRSWTLCLGVIISGSVELYIQER